MDRSHILPTVLFSSTLITLVTLSTATHSGLLRWNVKREPISWESPSKHIINKAIDDMRGDQRYYISNYDNLFRNISRQHGTDWLLMSAIAYAESRFTNDAVSHYGAQGLMQVTPRTAAQFGITSDMLHDPESNIWAANRAFNHIIEMLSLPDDITERDKTCLTLAAYNCGIGRVFDAQRLAKVEGCDPYKWRNISHYLQLLNTPEYYNHNQVYHGRFNGARTTKAYVNIVLQTYDQYRRNDPNMAWTFVWR